MYNDPIVDEVRKARERLAKEFNYGVGAIFRDLRQRQAQWGTRLVSRPKKGKTEGRAAPVDRPAHRSDAISEA